MLLRDQIAFFYQTFILFSNKFMHFLSFADFLLTTNKQIELLFLPFSSHDEGKFAYVFLQPCLKNSN